MNLENIQGVVILTDSQLTQIMGGWHPFPRGLFGRDGKPILGRDLVEKAVPAAVGAVVAIIPGGAPYAPLASAISRSVVKTQYSKK